MGLSLTYIIRKESFHVSNLLATALNTATLFFSHISTIWFWAVGYRILPLLGTPNFGFFFRRFVIDANGIHRYWLIESIGNFLQMFVFMTMAISSALNEKKETKRPFTWLLIAIIVLVEVFNIAAVEYPIVWNELSPTRDLLTPGQLIPLVGGIIMMIEAILDLA